MALARRKISYTKSRWIEFLCCLPLKLPSGLLCGICSCITVCNVDYSMEATSWGFTSPCNKNFLKEMTSYIAIAVFNNLAVLKEKIKTEQWQPSWELGLKKAHFNAFMLKDRRNNTCQYASFLIKKYDNLFLSKLVNVIYNIFNEHDYINTPILKMQRESLDVIAEKISQVILEKFPTNVLELANAKGVSTSNPNQLNEFCMGMLCDIITREFVFSRLELAGIDFYHNLENERQARLEYASGFSVFQADRYRMYRLPHPIKNNSNSEPYSVQTEDRTTVNQPK